MLSFQRGHKKIAKIKGGEYDGETLYLYDKDFKCCSQCSNKCIKASKQKKCCSNCSMTKKGSCSINDNEAFPLLELENGTIEPIPNENENDPDHVYIAAQTGAGKSYFIGDYLRDYDLDNKEIFIFSTFDKDDGLDHLKPTRVIIDSEMIDDPIQKEELQNSICIFDDIDTIRPKELADSCRELRDDLLQNGRKMNIKVLATSHQLMGYRATRDLLALTQKIVIFPRATSPYHIKKFLKEYIGLDKNDIKSVMNIKSRWIMICVNYPACIIWDKGCMIVNELSNIKLKTPNQSIKNVKVKKVKPKKK